MPTSRRGILSAMGALLRIRAGRGARGERPDDFQPPLVAITQALRRFIPEFAKLENFEQLHDAVGNGFFLGMITLATPERVTDVAVQVQVKNRADIVENRQRSK